MSYSVPALYVPKSVTYRRDGDDFLVDIKSISFGRAMLGCALIAFSFVVFPVVAIFNAGNALALWFLMVLGGVVLVIWTRGPTMRIGPHGVEVNGRLYRAEDASHFTDHVDDGWLFQFMELVKTGTLGLQYGIYSVHMPYALPKVELEKVAIFLTGLLKAQSPQLEVERTRKIQQAQAF